MGTGAITNHIDVAQLTLYAFWIFFAGLIFYLRREDKREGYPLDPDGSKPGQWVRGMPPMPPPKVFRLHDGREVYAPRPEEQFDPVTGGAPTSPWPGAPLRPTGNPLVDGIGPAAWANRSDTPDTLFESGEPKIVPMRVAKGYFIEPRDPNPVGMPVIAADGVQAGTVVDAWVDQSETLVRYLEVDANGRTVLLPMGFSRVSRKHGKVFVESVLAKHFADVPAIKNPDVITLLEEDKIQAYFGGGHLFATPSRSEPVL